ncbi:MAG: hypothetical protein Q3971_04330 [Moraxella sp.]|nr:hypothetical protein [Moraxella sp.]
MQNKTNTSFQEFLQIAETTDENFELINGQIVRLANTMSKKVSKWR